MCNDQKTERCATKIQIHLLAGKIKIKMNGNLNISVFTFNSADCFLVVLLIFIGNNEQQSVNSILAI